MKPTIVLLAAFTATLACVAGCGDKEPSELTPAVETPTAKTPAAQKSVELEITGLDLAGLKNATYIGIEEQDPVTLKDGVWEDEPYDAGGASRPSVHFVRDFLLVGDIDGDGTEEAAVLLGAGAGGTGENIYLAAVRLVDGKLKNLDTVLVGDRVQVRKAGFGKQHVFLEVLRAGPDDAMCCPGELAMVGWRLEGDVLAPLEVTTMPRRLSLDVIAETEWVLRWWNLDEQAPADPKVTLSFMDGRFGGKSGCNSYFTAPKPGQQPGDISTGPVGGTMMACPGEAMVVEQRYLAQLGSAKKYGFMAGMLALSYEVDGAHGVMLFERQKNK